MKRVLSLLFACIVTITTSAQWKNPAATHDGHSHGAAGDVPAYNAAPPSPAVKKKQKPILSGDQLTGPYFANAFQVQSYKLAAKIPDVLHQLPCYCYCDRGSEKHNSLRTCFETTHGAACSTCMQEAFFAYKMHKKGKTAKQIREAVVRGEHQVIDLRYASSIE